jgi:hypothetical protein
MHEALTFPATDVVLYPLLLVALFALFIAPGLAVGGWLASNRDLRAVYVVPVAALTGAVIGYGTLWAWFASPHRGPWLSGAIVLGDVGALAWLLARPSGPRMLRQMDVAVPLALVLLIALFYNAAVTSCLDAADIPCVFGGQTWDNALPQFFAEHIALGQPRMLVGDWLGSDRPPLQSGIVLSLNPLTRGVPFATVSYQLLGSLLQCLWVVGLWAAARRMRASTAAIAVMVAMCTFSGFFYYNSVYVWPKLLAAFFGLIGFFLLVAEPRRVLYWGLAGAFFAAGMLSHSGIVFTLVPIGAVLLLVRRYRPSLKMAAVGLAAAAVLMGPWLAYQKFYDPPGNRLMKWHLAGVVRVDDRGLGQALIDRYSTTPMGALVDARVRNVEMVLGAAHNGPHIGGTGFWAELRGYEWSATLLGIGLLNLGWLAFIIPAVRRRWSGSGIDRRLVRLVVGVGLTALALWTLVLFLPRDATIHQGSYLTMMMLMVSFAAMLTVWPKQVLAAVVALQFAYFGLVWIASYYIDGVTHHVSPNAITLMLLALAGLTGLLWQLIRRPTERDPGPVAAGAVALSVAWSGTLEQ